MKRVYVLLIVLLLSVSALAHDIGRSYSSTVTPTINVGSFPASSYGGNLRDAANRDPNTVLYCEFDHPDRTGKANCSNTPNSHRVVTNFSASDYFTQTGELLSVKRGCVVVYPTANTSSEIIDAYTAPNGWSLNWNAGTFSLITNGGTVSQAGAALNVTHVVCWGRDDVTGYISVDGAAATSGAITTSSDTGAVVGYGSTAAFPGAIGEIYADNTTPTAANVEALGDTVIVAKNAGYLVSGTPVFHAVGDDYNNGNWTARAGTALTKVGQPLAWDGLRYNWPSVAFAMNGTVPRVSQSGLYDRGFGVQHRASGPFSNVNYWSLGVGTDVLDFTTAGFAMCIITRNGTTTDSIVGDIDAANTKGWRFQINAGSQPIFSMDGLAGGVKQVLGSNTPSAHNVNCFGYGGGSLRLVANNNAEVTVANANAYTPASADPATLGYAPIGLGGLAGSIVEFYATTTPASTALLTQLRDQALNCVKPGPCFTPDANAVMHIDMDSALQGTGATAALYPQINTGADQWTRNGAITSSSSVLTFPYGVEGRDMPGAGPYTAATNYFSTLTGNDVFDFAGDFAITAISSGGASCSSFPVTAGDHDGTNGWLLYDVCNTSSIARFYSGGVIAEVTANDATTSIGNPRIVTWGRSGLTGYIKRNAGATVTGAVNAASALGAVGKIGDYGPGGPFLGPIHAIWATTTAPTTARLDAIHAAVLNQTGSMQYPTISTTRTTEATYEADGRLYRAPPGVSRVSPVSAFTNSESGRLVEGQYINTAQYSEQLDNAVWTATNVTVTANQGVFADGQTTMELLTNTANAEGDRVLYPATTASSATFTASAWFWAAATTKVGSIGFTCPGVTTASSCSCWRADGLTCTAAVVDTGNVSCLAYGTFDTVAPVRMAVEGTCSGAGTDPDVWLAGGQYLATSAAVLAGGVQMEVGLYPHEYCGPTLNATRQCNADVVTAPNPLRGLGSDWTNLLQYSDLWLSGGNFSEGGAAASTVTVNTGVAPDGSISAATISNGAVVGGQSSIWQTTVISLTAGTTYTFSGWVRGIAADGTTRVGKWNPATGGDGTSSSCPYTTAAWTRCTHTVAPTGTANYRMYWGSSPSRVGDPVAVAQSYLVWGGQVEVGATASNYCGPTLAASLTCGPGGAIGKVVTNAALNSETAGSWTASGLTSVTNNATTGPGNPAGAALLVEDGNNSEHYIAQNFTATAAAWTVSLYAKQKERTWIAVSPDGGTNKAWYNLATCAVGTVAAGSTAAAGAVANGFCRLRHSRTLGAGANSFRVYLASADNVTSYAGDGASGLYVAGMQAELGSAAEPYCGPTLGATKRCAPSQRWCIKTRVTPENGHSWVAGGGNKMIWALGSAAITANFAYLSDTYFGVTDGYGVQVYVNAYGSPATTPATLVACVNDGTPSLYINGVLSAAGLAGTGSGLMTTWQDTVYIGSRSTFFDGYYDGPYFCRDSDPYKCGFIP